MRLLRALRPPPRSLILAPVFGASVALVVLAQFPGPASGQYQYHKNQYCGDQTCQGIGSVEGLFPCSMKGVGCKLKGTVIFPMCRAFSATDCENNKTLYNSSNCGGNCETEVMEACGYLEVYHCSLGP